MEVNKKLKKVKKKKKSNDSDNLNINGGLIPEKEKKSIKSKKRVHLENEKDCDKEVSEKKHDHSSNEFDDLKNESNEKAIIKKTDSSNCLMNVDAIKEEFQDRKKRKRNEKNDVTKTSKSKDQNKDHNNEEETSDDDKSSSSDEDHDGLLLTSKFKKKFSNLLLKLKSKDANLLNKEENFFHDSDFDTDISDDENDTEKKQEEKKINENEKDNINKINNIPKKKENAETSEKYLNYSEYFKEILLKEGSQAFDKEEEELKEKEISSQKNKKNYFYEQEELKKKIIEACKVADENNGNDNSVENDDNFFIVKEKSEKELLEEKKYYENFLKTSNIVKDENNLLKEYWKDNLNKDEEFLRDYILKEMWREDKIQNLYEEIDEIDDEELEKAENFERTYNFRYEEQNGNIINSIPRNIETSVRIDLKKKKKKEKRQEKRKKKREQKKKMLLEEIKKENKGKKNEKNKLFNDNKTEMSKTLDTCNKEQKDPSKDPQNYDNEISSNKNSDLYNDESDLWFLCDGCNNPITPLNYVYECTTCENFALCKSCFKKQNHEHKLKKLLVPKNCKPSKEYLNNSEIKNNCEFNNNDTLEYLENDSSGYEDLIDGMPIRFKYIKVKPNSFNLTTDYILKTDDKTLNKIVPLKYVSPYYKKNFKSKIIGEKDQLNG